MANSTARATARKGKKDLGDKVEQATKHPWMQRLTRYGYFGRGILFAVIGFLALQVALGRGGAPTDQTGALTAIAGQPFGRILLSVIVVGLAGFSLWGFIRAVFDPLNRGNDAKGIIERIGYVISGVSYGSLLFPTLKLILGSSGGTEQSQTQKTQDITAQLLANPFGPWIIGIIGLMVIGWSAAQLYLAYTCKFEKDFRLRKMSADEENLARHIGQIGIGARALVFALIGAFFVQAALQRDANEAKGLDGALLSLAQWEGGPWLLTFAAVGLIVFGLYSMLSARWMDVA